MKFFYTPVRIAGIREPVHCDAGLRGMERFAHPVIQLVVGDRTPERGLIVHDRLALPMGQGVEGGGGHPGGVGLPAVVGHGGGEGGQLPARAPHPRAGG